MADYNRGGGGRGGYSKGGNDGGYKKSSYGNGRGGYRPNPVVVMHKATCAQCGKPCEVPFRPTGEKPVYCRDCFGGKKEDGFNETRAPRREYNNDRGGDRQERPSQSAPAPSQDSGELKRHLVDIGTKLDRRLSALEKSAVTPLVAEAPKKGPTLKAIVKKATGKKK